MNKEDFIYYANEAVRMIEVFITSFVVIGAVTFLWLKGII